MVASKLGDVYEILDIINFSDDLKLDHPLLVNDDEVPLVFTL